MKILLDTHAFLWFIGGDSKLNPFARSLIEDIDNDRYLSAASLWEMAIKKSIGKLKLYLPFTILFSKHIQGNRIELLPIDPVHLDMLSNLPFHHKDPFDRLIIAQAQCEGLSILSRDHAFDDYGVHRSWYGDLR